ncbi:HlyD family secretion protein [Flavobacterium fluviale]|uniref:HlyD family secretion protein n=1 Tax=Flavobacterium fluviale TaxID=2249356 RepID=UPI0013B3D457|nr:HlyD family secretion protein [Flavobacterium fluviale]
MLGNISQLKSSLNELKRNSKTTLTNESKEYTNLENNRIQAFHLLKESIDDWELNYVLKSSIHGKVNFLDIWFKNQTVNIGDNVFSIIPTSNTIYIGKLKAKALNSGKIKIGQLVNIKLNDFPHREFGMLKGQIKNISLIPDKEGNQLIDISLSNGLKTTSNKKILFKQEMQGNADNITEDLRLIERLLYQFKDLFKRS